MTLVALSVSWLVGVWIGAWAAPFARGAWAAALGFAAAGFLIKRPPLRQAALCAAMLALGAWRSAISVPYIGPRALAHYNDRGVAIVEGIVSADPERTKGMIRVRVAARNAELDEPNEVEGVLLATVQPYPEVRYGDLVRLCGKLLTPPVHGSFSYKDYLARQGVFSIMSSATATVLGHDRGSPVISALLAIRRHAASAIGRMLPEPEASLLTGILLGKDDGIPSDVYDAFRAAGTAHVIAISGFNITLIAGALTRLLRRAMRPMQAAALALAGVGVYTLLVGAEPPVVRAALMGGLYILASILGRQGHALTLLAAAALGMTVLRPQALWDVGFQLSFLATLGMILFVPALNRWARRLAGKLESGSSLGEWALQPLVISIAALVPTIPLMVYQFRMLTLLALPANLVVAPMQPAIMLLGGIATLLGSAWAPLGQVFAWAAWPFLAISIRATEWFASLPGSGIEVARPPLAAILGYYAGLGALIVFAPRLKGWAVRTAGTFAALARGWKAPAALAVAAALLWAGALRLPDGRTHVTFLNVGGGDAILVRTAQGATALIDGGADPARFLAELGRRLPFWERDIDLVVLTHPHVDHMGGLVAAAKRYRIGTFISGASSDNPMYRELLQRLEQSDTRIVRAADGQVLRLGGGVDLTVFWPLANAPDADANERSLVLRLDAGRASFLLTADVGPEGQASLLRGNAVQKCLLLKAPHHGSRHVLPEFLDASAPQLVVVTENPSAAANASAQIYLGLGARCLWTGVSGAVEVTTDGDRYWTSQRP